MVKVYQKTEQGWQIYPITNNDRIYSPIHYLGFERRQRLARFFSVGLLCTIFPPVFCLCAIYFWYLLPQIFNGSSLTF